MPASSPLSALSFVVPVHNEEASLRDLHAEIQEVSRQHHYTYELIFVDDGSDDESFSIITELCHKDPHVRAIRFRRNYGQAAALSAGIHASIHPLIVTLDADGQNDPSDVPAMLALLSPRCDVVSGWRRARKDSLVRRWPSKLANKLISRVTGIMLSDYGCTLKVYRREFLEGVPIYGEMHRFIPVLAAWQGAKVIEMPVHHRARTHGKSHYGLKRTWKVLLDLLTVKFLHTYVSRPMHFFGGIGMVLVSFGLATGVASAVLKWVQLRDFVETPLLLLSVFLLIIGVLFMVMGLLAELLIRIYFEQHGRAPYRITETVHVPSERS